VCRNRVFLIVADSLQGAKLVFRPTAIPENEFAAEVVGVFGGGGIVVFEVVAVAVAGADKF
jgi:hypothetical protein